MRPDKVRDQNLVAAAEAHAEDDGDHREVRAENASCHGRDSQVDDEGGEHDLEKLETDGFDSGREPDAYPVGQDDAGTLEVGAADFVMDFEMVDEEKDCRGDEPREHGRESDSLDSHFREAEIAVQEHDVHRGIRDDGDDVAEEVPDGEPVRGDKRSKRRLQCPECKADGDHVQKVAGVEGGIAGKSHPAHNVVGQ